MPAKQRACATCGADISDRPGRARWCRPCAAERKRVQSRADYKWNQDVRERGRMMRRPPPNMTRLKQQFPDNATAEAWLARFLWPNGPTCPRCGSGNVHDRPDRRAMPYYCGACQRYFSVKSCTVMRGSNLPYRTWAMAFVLVWHDYTTVAMHHALGIQQSTAWHLKERIKRMQQRAASRERPAIE